MTYMRRTTLGPHLQLADQLHGASTNKLNTAGNRNSWLRSPCRQGSAPMVVDISHPNLPLGLTACRGLHLMICEAITDVNGDSPWTVHTRVWSANLPHRQLLVRQSADTFVCESHTLTTTKLPQVEVSDWHMQWCWGHSLGLQANRAAEGPKLHAWTLRCKAPNNDITNHNCQLQCSKP